MGVLDKYDPQWSIIFKNIWVLVRSWKDILPSQSLVAGVYFTIIAALVFYPYLGEGYILTLDMVLGPDTDFINIILDRKGPLFYGRLLPALLFNLITGIGIPVWILQQTLLVGCIWFSGMATYVAVCDRSTPARLVGGTLYAFNPFVYTRLLAGHWWILLAYAILPLAIRLFYDAILGDRQHTRASLIGAGTAITGIAALGPHVLYLFAVAAALMLGVLLAIARRADTGVQDTLRRAVTITGGVLAVNAYWIVPAVWAMQSGLSRTSGFGIGQLRAFQTSAIIGGNSLLTTTMLYGFWRAGYRLLPVIESDALVVALFLPVLILAAIGATARDQERIEWRLTCVGLVFVGVVLGAGYGSPLIRDLYIWLYTYVPGFSGMRESQKFVALAAVGYAFLVAIGIDETATIVREQLSRATDRDGGDLNQVITERIQDPESVTQAASVVLAVALIGSLLVYSAPMIGLSGQVTATEYPDSWHTIDEELESQVTSSERVLFLPYHQYMPFPWVGRDVVPPAQHIFPNVVRGRNIELAGAVTQPRDPTHRELRKAVTQYIQEPETIQKRPFGARVSQVGVRYIVFAEVSDHHRYQFLQSDASLEQIRTADRLVLYRVTDPAPQPPTGWPRAGAPRLYIPLAIGSTFSVIAIVMGGWMLKRFWPNNFK